MVALFLLTFLVQPFLIPSESMEHTLLVGDFLLVNKQVFAPARSISDHLLPYRQVRRGDIVVFHHPEPHPYLVKRVVGIPGDRIRIEDGRVSVNGESLDEPYAAFEPAAPNQFPRQLSRRTCIRIRMSILSGGDRCRKLTRNGELVVPANDYFVLGDNRNHSLRFAFLGICAAPGDYCPAARNLLLRAPALDNGCARGPRMIDSDTIGNSRHASRPLRDGSVSSAWCTRSDCRDCRQPPWHRATG